MLLWRFTSCSLAPIAPHGGGGRHWSSVPSFIPWSFFLLVGLIIGAMGVVRYQEVASLARTAARYASTHGAKYRKDAGQAVGSGGTSSTTVNGLMCYQADPTKASGSDTSWTGDIYDNAIRPNL